MRLPFIRRKVYDELLKEKKQIDWLMWISGFIGPASTIPQIYIIFINKSSTNVSMLSWALYLSSTTVSLLYSIIHRLKPLMIGNLLWLAVDVVVIMGIVIYE